MNIVKDILDNKGYALWTIDPDGLVFDALTLMQDKNCGALLVMEGENLAGIMTERDYSRKVILKGLSSKTLAVREIMSSPVVCIRLDQTIEECIAIMAGKKGYSHHSRNEDQYKNKINKQGPKKGFVLPLEEALAILFRWN